MNAGGIARRTLALTGAFLISVPVGADAQARDVELSRSATLRIDRDPIDDRDNSRLRIRSSAHGVPADFVIACSGWYTDVHVNFEVPENGRALILRFGTERPDTFPQPIHSRMRVWGEGTVRMVMHPPTGIARIPRTAVGRVLRGLRSGTRMVARLEVDGLNRDAFFETAGAARAIPQLPCLHAAVPTAPRVLGRRSSLHDHDVEPEPADSAQTAHGLDVLRPVLTRGYLDYVLVHAVISAQGSVDSVGVFGLPESALEEQIERYVRTVRFTPARRDGQDVPSSLLFHLYKGEALPSRRR